MIYGIPHHTRDRDAGPWRKPCPKLGRRRSFDGRMRDCPRLAPRGSLVFAPACTPGSFACVPPACTPGVFCCAAVLPAAGGGGGWLFDSRARTQRSAHPVAGAQGAGCRLEPAPGTLASATSCQEREVLEPRASTPQSQQSNCRARRPFRICR